MAVTGSAATADICFLVNFKACKLLTPRSPAYRRTKVCDGNQPPMTFASHPEGKG